MIASSFEHAFPSSSAGSFLTQRRPMATCPASWSRMNVTVARHHFARGLGTSVGDVQRGRCTTYRAAIRETSSLHEPPGWDTADTLNVRQSVSMQPEGRVSPWYH